MAKTPSDTSTKWQLISQFIRSYLDRSAIHGLQYVVRRRITLFERYFWTVLVIVSLYYCINIGLLSLDRYNNKSCVVAVERDYYFWNTTLPSVTICPMQRISEHLFEDYCKAHHIPLHSQEAAILHEFVEQLANATYSNFHTLPDYNISIETVLQQINVSPQEYMQLIYNMTDDQSMPPRGADNKRTTRIRCSSENNYVSVRQVLTEHGICYTTNTLLDDMYTAHYFIFGTHSPDKADKELEERATNTIQTRHRNFFEPDLDYNFIGFMGAIDYYIHSSFEVSEIDRNFGITEDGYRHELDVVDMVVHEHFETDAKVFQRKCRFQHETNLHHYPLYTKNLCISEYRLKLAYELCKCIPHFYPNRFSRPKRVCSYQELRNCFPKHANRLIKLHEVHATDNANGDSKCVQNCRDAVVNKRAILDMQNSKLLMGGSGISICLGELPRYRLKRQIIFNLTDLMVSFGGTVGLFLGISVMAAIEFIYYFTLRLICHFYNYDI